MSWLTWSTLLVYLLGSYCVWTTYGNTRNVIYNDGFTIRQFKPHILWYLPGGDKRCEKFIRELVSKNLDEKRRRYIADWYVRQAIILGENKVWNVWHVSKENLCKECAKDVIGDKRKFWWRNLAAPLLWFPLLIAHPFVKIYKAFTS